MADLDSLLSQLDNFWKGKRAVKKLIELGVNEPQRIVPPLMELMDNPDEDISKNANHAFKQIADKVDLMPVLFKVPVVKTLWQTTRPKKSIYCLKVGRLRGTPVTAVGSRDSNVYVFDLEGTLLWRGMESSSGITCLDIGILGDDHVIVAGSGKAFGDASDTNVYAWDESGKLLWRGIETESWVSSVVIGELGGKDVVVGGCGGLFSNSINLFVWDEEGKVLWRGNEPMSWVSRVEIINSDQGDMVAATCGDNTLYMWDDHGHLKWRGDQPVGALTDMAVGKLGKKEVVVGISSDLYVWDLSGNLLWVATHPNTWLRSVAISKYMGRRVVIAGSGDGTVYIWDPDGKLLKKYEDPDDGVNEIKVGKIGDQSMIAGGSRDGKLYMWTAGEKDPWLGEQSRKEINDVEIFNDGKMNMIFTGSRDRCVCAYQSIYSSVDELLGELENKMPCPELREEYEDISNSLKGFTSDNKKEIYSEIKSLTHNIMQMENEVKGLLEEIEQKKDYIDKFKNRGLETTEMERLLTKIQKAVREGYIDKAKDLHHDLTRKISKTQNKIKSEDRKRNRFKKWIDGLDVEYEKVTDELMDDLEPIFTKFMDVEENDTIDKRMKEIRKDITKLKDISRSYMNIQSNNKYKGSLAKELKNKVEKKGKELKDELDSLRGLREEKENGILMIKDPARTLVMQYESGDSWVDPKEIARKIDKLQKDIKKEIIKTDSRVESVMRSIRIENGIDDVFMPKIYSTRDEIIESIEKLKKDTIKSIGKNFDLDISSIEEHLKRGDSKEASRSLNILRYKVRKYKTIEEEIDKLSKKKKKLPTIVARGEIDESFYVQEDKRIAGVIKDLGRESETLRSEIFV